MIKVSNGFTAAEVALPDGKKSCFCSSKTFGLGKMIDFRGNCAADFSLLAEFICWFRNLREGVKAGPFNEPMQEPERSYMLKAIDMMQGPYGYLVEIPHVCMTIHPNDTRSARGGELDGALYPVLFQGSDIDVSLDQETNLGHIRIGNLCQLKKN